MDKNELLKSIAETGYNVGLGAKLHFSTFDIAGKVPGWIGLFTTLIGLYSLVFDQLTSKHLAATLLAVGICSLYISAYDLTKYEKVGKELTLLFNRLRDLYRDTKASDTDDALMNIATSLRDIETEFNDASLSRQIVLSNWYAHYKLFWEHQIDWIDEQKGFRFFRDKVPLSFWLVIVALVGVLFWVWLRQCT